MFVGHYGVSFVGKRLAPTVSLATLFIAVQLLDVAWSLLVLLGIEKVRIVPGITATNPLDLYYMPYTHSLIAALGWSAATFLIYSRFAPMATVRSSLVVAAAVFSHWVLDFLVHRPDLPLFGNSAKVGLGLWNYRALAFGLEIAVLFGGLALYFGLGVKRRGAIIAFGIVMLALQAYIFFGPPPSSDRAAAITALAAYILFAAVIRVLERRAARVARTA
jgi:hypothetical protein